MKNFYLDSIESCEQTGEWLDEYVYDVEVEDNSHTFIGNDILVHNSVFVSFDPAIKSCNWKNRVLDIIDDIDYTFILIERKSNTDTKNKNMLDYFKIVENRLSEDHIQSIKESILLNNPNKLIIDGCFVKDYNLNREDFTSFLSDMSIEIVWNWYEELDFIQGIDFFRYAGYFKNRLEEYAKSYGVDNKQDFELERISESIINIAKKKYIQHIVYEDGIDYDRLKYIFPKGVELIRSSTPLFARDKIINIVNYLFEHPDTFNIKDLINLVKDLRRQFELADPDDICMQSSVSNYESKVLDDLNGLSFISGAHFAVKASAYHNFLLNRDKELQKKYEFIKSGTKIKYYYVKNNSINDIFAFIRGSYPMEFAPEMDYDIQFFKSIITPINSIIEPLGLPNITKRLRVVMDVFGGF
jgi:hypothetical protein